jgi:hypothetical protein
MKKLVALLLAGAIAVGAADYLGWLGDTQMDMSDVLQFRVRPVDKNTGQIVTDVHVTCVRKGSEEACSQKEASGDGVITVNFLVRKSVKLSRVFKFQLKEKIWMNEDADLALVFIQPNYDRYWLVLKAGDLVEWVDKVKDVPLESLSTGVGQSGSQ